MSTWEKTWGKSRLCVAAAAFMLHGIPAAEAANVRIGDTTTVFHLQAAINRAHERLGQRSCQGLFSDFRDLSGKRLEEVLAEQGGSGQSHLDGLFFYDGDRTGVCKGRGAAAVTSPGSHVIYVCPTEFRKVSEEPRKAAATVVHELLHTLGLGENPPTSRAITKRVLERCWFGDEQ